VGDLQHRPIAAQNLDADVEPLVHPDDRRVSPLAADVDPDDDPLTVLEARLPGARLPGADRQPVVRGFDPLIADEAPEGRLRQSLALLAELLGGDPACGVAAANEVE